jgi:hypothetical protein
MKPKYLPLLLIAPLLLAGCDSATNRHAGVDYPDGVAKREARIDPASHFAVTTVGDIAAADKEKIVAALETHYARISTNLQTTPAQPFEVFIYETRRGYTRATGNGGASGSIEGAGKLHMLQQSRSGDKAETIAVHEFAHAITLKLLTDHEPQPLDVVKFDRKFKKFPVWLWEAIAVYEAQQFTHPKKLSFITKTSCPSLDQLSNRSKGEIYKVGYCIIEFILSKYGQDGLITLILAYGDVVALKTTQAEFSKGWHDFVINKYFNEGD